MGRRGGHCFIAARGWCAGDEDAELKNRHAWLFFRIHGSSSALRSEGGTGQPDYESSTAVQTYESGDGHLSE